MFSEEHLYSIALRKCKLIGDVHFHQLVTEFGSAKNVWHYSKKELGKIDGIGSKIVSDIGNPEHLKFAEKEIQFCESHNIKILLRHWTELPYLLNECMDAPAILYQKGTLDKKLKAISMVGTRNITAYGRQFIHDFFKEIPSKKVVSVSGLALGIDSEVHMKSVENKIPTIAVLAHGFQTIYPAKNRKLSEKILEENGAIVTEFNSSQKPDRQNFIQRNRIIAGFSSTTFVVETAFGGGSISTVNFANSYNRDVFALPGKITDLYSQGCNLIISQNKAAAIASIQFVIELLGIENDHGKIQELFPTTEIPLNNTQEIIFKTLRNFPKINLDELSHKTQISAQKTATILLELELLGLVKSLSGKQFVAL